MAKYLLESEKYQANSVKYLSKKYLIDDPLDKSSNLVTLG